VESREDFRFRFYDAVLSQIFRLIIEDTLDEQSRAFKVFIVARNGAITELVRLRRVNGSWNVARMVDASYYSGISGVVLEEIDKDFPIDALASDNDWNNMKTSERLTIKETN